MEGSRPFPPQQRGGKVASNQDLIPGLPEDLSLRILSLFPTSQHKALAGVSRGWRNLVKGGGLRAARRAFGLLKPCLFMVLENAKSGQLYLVWYEPGSRSWRNRRPLPRRLAQREGGDRSEAVNGFGLVALEGHLYLIGGFDRLQDGTDRCLNSVFRYDLAFDSWQRVADMHAPRFLFASGVLDGRIYVAGGLYFEPSSHVRDRTLNAEVYDPASDTWHRLPDTHLHRLRGPDFGLLLDNKFTILSEDAALAEAYDRELQEWTPISGPPLPDRPTKVTVAPNGRICVLQNLWPSYKYRVCVREQGQGPLHAIAEWSADRPGPVAHPRELVAIGEKVYLVGNEHPRAIRKRHGYQGPNPVQIAVYDLNPADPKARSGGEEGTGSGGGEKPEGQVGFEGGSPGSSPPARGGSSDSWRGWRREASKQLVGSWVMGCAVMAV